MRSLFFIFIIWTNCAFSQEVFRCGNSYSSEKCTDAKTVETTPAVTDPDITTIYHCWPDYGKPFWVEQKCSSIGPKIREVESYRVPKKMSLDEQVNFVSRDKAQKQKQKQ